MLQELCKPRAKSLLYAEVQPILAGELSISPAKLYIFIQKAKEILQKVHICPPFLANMHFSCDKYSFLFEVPNRHVVVEGDAFGAAEHGDDLHDVFLLLG